MRISDWSSVLCASDLSAQLAFGQPRVDDVDRDVLVAAAEQQVRPQLGLDDQAQLRAIVGQEAAHRAGQVVGQVDVLDPVAPKRARARRAGGRRSEAHTSEIQSLLRNSYAHCSLTIKST